MGGSTKDGPLCHTKLAPKSSATPRTDDIEDDELDRAPSEGLELLFQNNWPTALKARVWDHVEGTCVDCFSTQGNLYSAIRFGNINLLTASNVLPVPMTWRDIQARLSEPHFPVARTCQFRMSLDAGHAVQREKRESIRRIAGDRVAVTMHRVEDVPAFRGLDIVPTGYICVFDFSTDRDETLEVLKKALYRPARDRKTETDRFRLEAHGLLVS